ncbi:MAG: Rieske (2Fe-2S) protein [SAR202 cluster bacterium]|nr:Rieske (2Fe-2S) protein [SAR202 cluster bacterium]
MGTGADVFDLCSLDDIKRWGTKTFDFRHPARGYHEIALFWDGKDVYAIEAKCPHALAPLAGGAVFAGKVQCPEHGALFDLRTGECLDRYTTDTAAYRAEVRDGRVLVSVPGEQRA